MKAYKGFNKDMTCRGFQFAEGQTYELPEGETAKLCENGFHACEAPVDCLKYYDPAHSVYHEVELDGVTDEIAEDSKRVGSKIKIGARLDVAGIVKAQFEFAKEHYTDKCENGDSGVSSSGDGGVSSSGYRGVSSSGYRGVSSSGDSGVSSSGDGGVSSSGYSGVSSSGYRGVSSSGDRGVSSSGDGGVSSSRGASQTGKGGIACARGNGVKVRGDLGAVLVIAVENDADYSIKEWKAGVVDGETLKPDTWYTVEDGEWKEVPDADADN